jgi:hypothetical protein
MELFQSIKKIPLASIVVVFALHVVSTPNPEKVEPESSLPL